MDYSEEEFDLKELKSSCERRFEMFAKCRMKMCERRNVPSLAFHRDVFYGWEDGKKSFYENSRPNGNNSNVRWGHQNVNVRKL